MTSLFACAAGTPAAQAHTPKEGDIWATVGPMAYRTQTKLELEDGSPYVGGGVSVEADVDYNGGIEIAMIYLDKLYVRRQEDRQLAESIKRMHITTGYRHWFVPWLSAGLAFYSSYSMGDPKVVQDGRRPDQEFTTSARSITEYGFDTSIQVQLYDDGLFGAVLDTRYAASTSRKSKEDADHYGVLLGFKYLVPKR